MIIASNKGFTVPNFVNDLLFNRVDCSPRVMLKKRWHHDKHARVAKAMAYLDIPNGERVLIHLKGLFGT